MAKILVMINRRQVPSIYVDIFPFRVNLFLRKAFPVTFYTFFFKLKINTYSLTKIEKKRKGKKKEKFMTLSPNN